MSQKIQSATEIEFSANQKEVGKIPTSFLFFFKSL